MHETAQRARQLVDETVRPSVRDWEAAAAYPRQVAAASGLTGLFAPTSAGGLDLGFEDGMAVFEELGRGDAAFAFSLSMHNAVAAAMGTAAPPELAARWAPRLAAGEALGGFSLTEPHAGSDATAITTRAEPVNGGFRLNGVKAWVSNGGVADLYNVMARTGTEPGARGVSSFVVERTRPGVSFGPRDRKMAAGALPTCRMHLEDVWVPAENLLGVEGEGLRAAFATIDAARAVVAAMATGIAAAALDEAAGYAKERRAFGQPIAAFQGLQFLLADAAARVEASRWLAYRAAWLYDRGLPATSACAMAKLVAVEAAEAVTSRAVDVFGGYGLLRDYPVERYFRWAKVAAFLDGTQQIQQLVIARGLLR
jgi:alkylation response protein AidB-like acyl-CoA dehydrogenase